MLKSRNSAGDIRTRWYLQQFLKYAYAFICNEDYYIVWDSDSIPIRNINFFDDKNRPYFSMTKEYHKPYFDTMSVLLPGLKKTVNGSFICAHMVFKVEIVREMIAKIESNTEVAGKQFYEKIINAINYDMIPFTGFSEFETYGTYVSLNHPEAYSFRVMNVDRYLSSYFRKENFNERSRLWMANYFDIVCFEGWCKYNPFLHCIMSCPLIQKKYSADEVTGKILSIRRYKNQRLEGIMDFLRPIYRKLKFYLNLKNK